MGSLRTYEVTHDPFEVPTFKNTIRIYSTKAQVCEILIQP
jgi:hypothetical protein